MGNTSSLLHLVACSGFLLFLEWALLAPASGTFLATSFPSSYQDIAKQYLQRCPWQLLFKVVRKIPYS